MSFNHRVVKHYNSYTNENYFCIHEVYYDNNGNIKYITENPICPIGNDFDDLFLTIQNIIKAFDNKVISYHSLIKTFEQEENKKNEQDEQD